MPDFINTERRARAKTYERFQDHFNGWQVSCKGSQPHSSGSKINIKHNDESLCLNMHAYEFISHIRNHHKCVTSQSVASSVMDGRE